MFKEFSFNILPVLDFTLSGNRVCYKLARGKAQMGICGVSPPHHSIKNGKPKTSQKLFSCFYQSGPNRTLKTHNQEGHLIEMTMA